MRDKAAKSAYDKARYAARYVDERRRGCAREGCEAIVIQPRHGRRLYCSASCRAKAFYRAHFVSKPRESWDTSAPPLPMTYVGDPVFAQARALLAYETGSDFEDDILGEAVLAIMESRDPKAAIRRFLAAEKGHKARRVDGVDDVGYADGRLVIVWERKVAA